MLASPKVWTLEQLLGARKFERSAFLFIKCSVTKVSNVYFS